MSPIQFLLSWTARCCLVYCHYIPYHWPIPTETIFDLALVIIYVIVLTSVLTYTYDNFLIVFCVTYY